MSANERLTIIARLQGANQIAREAAKSQAAIRGMGKAARDLDRDMDKVHKRSFLFNQAMFTARRVLFGLTVGATTAGAALAGLGIKFRATMEQGEVGMEFMLKSAALAKDEMAALLELSRETIFDLPSITEAGRRLLGMGFDVQQTNSYIMAMAENMAVMGQGADTFDRIITAFGQIRSRGKLAGQEMLQLVNAQVPVYEILREELGLTGEQLANIADTGVRADIALDALTRGMTKRFGGANAAMLSTVNGQWQKFKENIQIIMGEVMMAPFRAIQQNFPEVNKVLNDMTKAMKDEGFFAMVKALDDGANAGGRLVESLNTLHRFASQLAQFFSSGFGPALLDTIKLLAFITKWTLFVIGGFLALSTHIPGLKFLLTALILVWTAHKVALILNYFWLRRNSWAIVQSTKWIYKQIKAIYLWAIAEKKGRYGFAAGYRTQNLFAKGLRLVIAQMKLMVIWTRNLTFSLQGLKTAILTMPIIGWALAIITLLIMLETQWGLVTKAIKKTFDMIKKLFNYVGDHKDLLLLGIPGIGPAVYGGKKIIDQFAGGGTARQTGSYMVGERGPEIVNLPARATVTPMTANLAGAGGGITVQVFPQAVNLDGRQIAEVVWKHKLDRFARR
jgi:tape measure domain-containing protein